MKRISSFYATFYSVQFPSRLGSCGFLQPSLLVSWNQVLLEHQLGIMVQNSLLDVGIFRLIQIALSILSVVSSLVGSISPYVFVRNLPQSQEWEDQRRRLNYKVGKFEKNFYNIFKIFLIMATFGIMFMISCFSVYAYWRTIPLRSPRFEITVSYNQPEFNDKPPAYDRNG